MVDEVVVLVVLYENVLVRVPAWRCMEMRGDAGRYSVWTVVLVVLYENVLVRVPAIHGH